MAVGVIGGGWAGLAAAITLAERGIAVSVFESAAQLGGRARRVELNGLALDNGQHILLGAYQQTLRLLEQIGVDLHTACAAPPLTLQIAPDFYLRAAALPAPLHLGLGLLNSRGISMRDKLAAMRFLIGLKREKFRTAADMTVSALLDEHRQSHALNTNLWHPLCLAALNTPPQLAAAQIFVNVLRDAFFTTRDASRLLLPRLDLGQLLPDPAARFIRAHGGEIHLNQRIERVDIAQDGFALHHAQGRTHFTHVVCAVAPFRVADLLGDLPVLAKVMAQIDALQYQAIYTVYLQYSASTRLPFPMQGLSNAMSQWVFDRGALSGQPGLMSVIISAAGAHETLPHAELAAHVARELHAQLGLPAHVEWSQVIAEKRATFAALPALSRPQNVTPLPGIYLAGDYTVGDYPATLESAVRSGIQCAHLISKALP